MRGRPRLISSSSPGDRKRYPADKCWGVLGKVPRLRPLGTSSGRLRAHGCAGVLGGFTLIELLVVISMVALLLGILTPVLGKARKKAHCVTCLSRMRQIGMASVMYVQDNDGYFARSSHSAASVGCLRWGPAFMPYLGYGPYKGSKTPAWEAAFQKFYRCPSDRRKNLTYSYGKNVWFELEPYETGEALGISKGPTYHTMMQVRHPGTTIEFGELRSPGGEDHLMAHFWLMDTNILEGIKTTLEIDTERHGGMANYIYVDGHVETQPFEETFDLKKNIDRWNPGKTAGQHTLISGRR